MNITKILFSVIAAIMIVTNTNATTMCVTDDMEQVILDPSIDGTDKGQSTTEQTWWADFDYGRVNGIATCNSTQGMSATAYPEYNFDNNHASSEGVYCWCRMTSPVRSAWVSRHEYGSASECASRCASYCGSNVRDYSIFRGGVFGSAGN